jgi:hypothetical protein
MRGRRLMGRWAQASLAGGGASLGSLGRRLGLIGGSLGAPGGVRRGRVAPGSDLSPLRGSFEVGFGDFERADLGKVMPWAGYPALSGRLEGTGAQAESLILAQNERWRRA